MPRSSSRNNTEGGVNNASEDPLAAPASHRFNPTSSFVEERTNSIREQLEHFIEEQDGHDDETTNHNNPDEATLTTLINGDSATPSSAASTTNYACILSGAVVNLCSATLGAGVLSLPHACREAGLIGAALLLAVAAASTIASIRILVRACTYYQLYTYESLCHVLYGAKLRTAVECGIVLFCQGCAVAYIIAMADILEQAKLLVWQSRAWSMVIIWFFLLLPLSLQRTMAALQMSSAVGIASIGTLVFAALIHLLDDEEQYHHKHDNSNSTTNATIMTNRHGWDEHDFYQNVDDATANSSTQAVVVDIVERLGHAIWMQMVGSANDDGDDDNEHSPSHPVDWSTLLWPQRGILSLLTAAPIMLFAFSCQVNVCAIYEELPRIPGPSSTVELSSTPINPKELLMRRVTAVAVALCALLYASVSAIALADFGTDVTPNMLQAYPMKGIMQVAASAMVLAVTMAFPLNIFPARVTLEGVFSSSDNGGTEGSSWGCCTRTARDEERADGGGCCSRLCSCCLGCFRRRPDRVDSEAHATLTAALLEDQDEVEYDGDAARSSIRSSSSRSALPHRRETATVNDILTAGDIAEMSNSVWGTSDDSERSAPPHRRETATVNDTLTAGDIAEMSSHSFRSSNNSNNSSPGPPAHRRETATVNNVATAADIAQLTDLCDVDDVSSREDSVVREEADHEIIENGIGGSARVNTATTIPQADQNGESPVDPPCTTATATTTSNAPATPPFPWFRHISLTLLLAGSALGIALVAPNISIVFQIIGGTASSGLGFCVPGLLGLRMPRRQHGHFTSYLLLYVGILMAIFTTGVTIYQIITGTV